MFLLVGGLWVVVWELILGDSVVVVVVVVGVVVVRRWIGSDPGKWRMEEGRGGRRVA
jgi:hypothetical protein